MKRILWASYTLLLFGCTSTKVIENKATCTYEGSDEKVNIKQNIQLHAKDDTLDRVVDTVTFTFEDVERYQEDITKQETAFKAKEACAEMLDNKKCSKSVQFSWEMKENVLTATTFTNVEKAIELKERIKLLAGVHEDKGYVSFNKTIDALKARGYTCDKPKNKQNRTIKTRM